MGDVGWCSEGGRYLSLGSRKIPDKEKSPKVAPVQPQQLLSRVSQKPNYCIHRGKVRATSAIRQMSKGQATPLNLPHVHGKNSILRQLGVLIDVKFNSCFSRTAAVRSALRDVESLHCCIPRYATLCLIRHYD
jgi:hypothetical protein